MNRGIMREMNPALYSSQFDSWVGPMGSFGDPMAQYALTENSSGLIHGPGGPYGT